MITRTTLKTLWLAGGGVLATWLAVSPNQSVPTTSPTAPSERPSQSRQMSADDLNARAERLRSRTNAVAPQGSDRNPFRFNTPKTAAPGGHRGDSPAPVEVAPPVPAAPPAPSLKLAGVAEKKTPDGTKRTAVLSGDGQIYLVGVGDSVAGRYTVVAIDPEAVVLRDAGGAQFRLGFR